MREAGFTVWRENTGWASFGPFAAIPKIPKLYFAWQAATRHIFASKPDVLVLVDFGAFNVRLAQRLRRMHYGGTIVDLFPPGAWLDSERTARAVAAVALPLTAFAHQHEFYAARGLQAAYFGHPLASQYAMRPPREAPPRDGGTVAILPGSRPAELRYHVPALLNAFRDLKRKRPYARAVIGAPDERIERELRSAAARAQLNDVTFARGTRAAIAQADAAWVASGTAVLECALSGVPCAAMYIVSPLLERYVRKVYSRRFFTLPNLVLGREIVPEILQERATPANLSTAMDEISARSGPAIRRAGGASRGAWFRRRAPAMRCVRRSGGAQRCRVVRIYHTSDLHDHRGIEAPLRALRERESGLLFDCGDSLRGSQTVYHRQEPIIGEIDAAGYDAQAMGNREFHYVFGCVRARAARMRHPLICSNLVDLKERELPFLRSHVIESGGVRVHLLGLLVMQYPAGSPWERVFGWRFLDPATVVGEYACSLPQDEPLVVLSHIGLRLDRKLAAAVPRITLLLGGHSHDTLAQPEVIAGVPIVHAGPYGKFVSQSDIAYAQGRWTLREFALRPLLGV